MGMDGMTKAPICPRCGEPMLWNGRGLACLACPYFTQDLQPPSEKKMRIPKRRKNDKK